MKYLKLYESFETDIEDILLEITDLNYSYAINDKHNELGIYNSAYIAITKIDNQGKYEFINGNDIKDCVLRLKDYIGNRYICCKIYSNNPFESKTFELTEDCDLKSPYGLLIYYKKK
jgi:hypothetical protein